MHDEGSDLQGLDTIIYAICLALSAADVEDLFIAGKEIASCIDALLFATTTFVLVLANWMCDDEHVTRIDLMYLQPHLLLY
jgi:hypothetical protein